ncbi:hypothetical protein MCBMB27_04211 [Methylobacterium phyllosphaerae]|uniref:Uncharacterized protein n=1 Tax=Methylobacterium phyllosphaerae TaxID=418223 RepID=A0AAE8HXK9_9HYPH|nr:hypothetical protein [Methylobacterium phyllosphaerae]APT33502.1 hypothetical protein MCBMB27_04211 [Methylobacterium phyllosphaerae]SFH64488.1 hypothetical protein SAMN05192567_13914 [Methylobacterium phyllosphaerae]
MIADTARKTKGAIIPAESPLAKPMPALVVFGVDKSGKPHAAWFGVTDVRLATKAADTIGFRTFVLCDEAQRAATADLPQGRVFGSGRAFVPFVAREVYERLQALADEPKCLTSSSIRVVAQGPAEPADDDAGCPGGSGPVDPRYPRSWAGIANGSLVLITEGEDDGWYEAVVVASKPGGEFTLQWRDWPDLPLLVRRRDEMALLHPNAAAAAAA